MLTSSEPSRFALPKTEFIALFALMTSLTAMSIDILLPALPEIGQSLQVTKSNDSQWIVTAFILGMVFGELPAGPLSDAIGRKKVILLGLALFCTGAALSMTAQSMSQLLIGRVIQGIGVSGPKIASRALIRDRFEGRAMAQIMSFVMMVFILIPMLAPALGQLIVLLSGWRSVFMVFLLLALIVALWLGLRQPETLKLEARIPLSPARLAQNMGRILRHKAVMAYATTAGLIFGAKLLYLSTAQAIFQDLYQVGNLFPMFFAMLASGIGLASLTNGKLVIRLGMSLMTRAALSTMVILSAILLLVAWGYSGVPPMWLFMMLGFGLFFCVGTLFGNINALAMQPLGPIAGLGASVIASFSSLVAVVVAGVFGHFYDGTLYALAIGFLCSASLALWLVWQAEKVSCDVL